MKVAFDEQIFVSQSRGGISRYFTELIRALGREELGDVYPVLPWRWTCNQHAAAEHLGRYLPSSRPRPTLLRALNAASRRQMRHVDVLHFTYYDTRFLRAGAEVLKVITVHDMVPELLPEAFAGDGSHVSKQRFIAAADLILCVSQTTRRDLLRLTDVDAERVVVTPLGVSGAFRPGLPPLPELPPRYLLYVGERKGYKDFATLCQAFAEISSQLPDTALVAVGGGALRTAEVERLSGLGLSGKVMQVDLGETYLARAYCNALAFAMPSRYEGFGLPALEAMASGCPVVLSTGGSLPEVGGNAAGYFTPGDSSELAARLLEAADRDNARHMVTRGLARASAFSWTATAAATAASYVALVDGTR